MPQGQLGRIMRAMREHKPDAAADRRPRHPVAQTRDETVHHSVGWHVTD